MDTQQIAQRLVELCEAGKDDQAHRELYAEDAVSIEPEGMPGFDKRTSGLPAIAEKGRKFASMVETRHSVKLSKPLVSQSAFALHYAMDVTMKGRPRETMSELCLYEVKNGKIVREEFFW